MTSPAITIAIPVYNVEKYVERSLLSALNQDITVPYEILILDDKGTDNSIKIVNRIKQEHERGDIIRIIENKDNKGQGETRNTAIDETHSKYLYFLDSDDWMTPDCLRLLYEKAESSDAEITHGSVDRIIEETNKISWSNRYEDSIIEHEAVGLHLFLNNKPTHIECWNKLFRVDFLRKHNIRCTHRVMEDVVFEFRCACLAYKYAFVPQVTMIYNIRMGSTLTEVRGQKGNEYTAFAFSDIPRVLRKCIKKEFAALDGVWEYYSYKVMDMCRNLAYSTYDEEQERMIRRNLKGMMTGVPGIRCFSQPIDRFLYTLLFVKKEDYKTYNYYRNIYWKKHQAILERLFGSWPAKIKNIISIFKDI
jgi:glycosyltransferase involved in cell wall biosynthesis